MKQQTITNQDALGLWSNARDSIEHALEHFSNLSNNRSSDANHDRKWIILSVNHAAEIFTYVILKDFDQNNSAFYRKGKHYYPGLEKAIRALQHKDNNFPLTEFEKDIFGFFRKLNTMRDKIMHGEMPSDVDVSIAAMTIVGISKISKKRCGESADDIYRQYPSVQRDVSESIKYSKIDEYTKFVEKYVLELTGDEWIPQCPSCAGHTILDSACEACFEELSLIECPHCGEDTYIIDSHPFDQNCGECGKKVTTGIA